MCPYFKDTLYNNSLVSTLPQFFNTIHKTEPGEQATLYTSNMYGYIPVKVEEGW